MNTPVPGTSENGDYFDIDQTLIDTSFTSTGQQDGNNGSVGHEPGHALSNDRQGEVAHSLVVHRGDIEYDESDWDNGKLLTPEECAALMKLSTCERRRAMNIKVRKRMEADLAEEFKKLHGEFSLTKKPKATHWRRQKPVPSNEPPHQSRRNKNTWVPLQFSSIQLDTSLLTVLKVAVLTLLPPNVQIEPIQSKYPMC